MKRHIFFPFAVCLISFSIICALCGGSIAQDTAPLRPPAWSVGDWWTVECQVYNSGKIVSGPTIPAWGPRVAWRFRVESLEDIEDQSFFVVSVKPLQNNSCPYWFRYWFRVSDRYIGRHELYHPESTGTKTRTIGPPIVIKDFPVAGTAPFFTSEFPTLAMTVPLFDVDRRTIPFEPMGGKFKLIQETEEVDKLAVAEKADERILPKIETESMVESELITISTESNILESQYWNTKLPWAIYGERFEGNSISRRYWLVEAGRD